MRKHRGKQAWAMKRKAENSTVDNDNATCTSPGNDNNNPSEQHSIEFEHDNRDKNNDNISLQPECSTLHSSEAPDVSESPENPFTRFESDESKDAKIGRRIVNVNDFFTQLQEISTHGPMNCGLQSVKIISEKRNGLVSQITLQCRLCNMLFFVNSDNAKTEMDLNTCAVAGTISIGCGHSQLTDLIAAVGLPTISKKVFSSKMTVVQNKWEAELLKSMSEAADEERRLALEEGRVNSEGIPIIDVIADGCYGKRSYKKNYSSLSGAAAIIGRKTNKILYLAIRNKYCAICSVAQSKNIEAKDHVCYVNYKGPSTGMESDILVEGFKKSITMHNLIYGRLISDGDANTYSKILQTRPYDGYTVEKVECRNHLLRNMCNKLAALTTDTKYLLKYRKYITKKRILAMRKVITEAIKKYKDSTNITALHRDILVAPEHAFGHHEKCKEYFCKTTENDKNIENELFSNSIWQRIKLIITQIAAHSRSLIVDVDSNSVERYHSLVAKFVGGKRINFSQRDQYGMRCRVAALSFNMQKPMSALHKSIVGCTPDNQIALNELRRQKSRSLAQKYFRKKRRIFGEPNRLDSTNYGEDCSKPDMPDEMLEISKKEFIKNLMKNTEERERIMKETVLQSGSSEWMELRRNILTSSNFGRIAKRRMDISCHNIVKDILYKKSLENVASIKHGKDCEKDALDQLSKQERVSIDPCGLFIDPNVPFFGATPDGVIRESDTIVEVKCPKTSYKIGIEKAIKEKKIPFYKILKTGSVVVNKDHNWYYQVQGQLHVTQKRKCLFGIWSGEEFPVKTEIIERDDKFWKEKMEKKLKDFYMDCILPELIDPRYPRKMVIRDPIYIKEAIEKKQTKQKDAKKRKLAPASSSEITLDEILQSTSSVSSSKRKKI